MNSATLRLCSLAEQCHTQNFYLKCFKMDFDAVKSKVGLLNKYIKTSYSVHSPLTVLVPPPFNICFLFGYLSCLKSDLDVEKSKVNLLNE